MKSWLKFFGLSFFSDKIAKEARIRGVMNCVLGFVFTLIFIFCGILTANTVPFYTHYDNASDFRSFLYNALDNAAISVVGGRVSSDNVVNTYLNEADAVNFGRGGYNLVLDTRPSTALDDFEAYCISSGGEEISYEKYLALTDEEKKNYEFRVRYTENELVLTDGLVSGYENYLGASNDEEVKKQYAALAENKGNVAADEYNRSIYALYVHTYYPEISAYEREGEVPLLRSYYYRNYLNDDKTAKSLFLFDDVFFGFFNTDSGVEVTSYGSFGKLSDGALTSENADGFIKGAFAASVSVSANVYLMNMFRFIPFLALIPVILALILKLALVLMKDAKYKKYTTCLKIEFSYLFIGSFITALILFICGFFVSSEILNILPLIIFASVLTVRTIVFLIYEFISVKKSPAKVPEETETEESESEAS